MLGAELSSPSDWLQSGRALGILDSFALQHRGATPVMVFPDTSGSFTNDTECVNGPRGNAADHLIKEFVPFVVSNFGVSSQASSWGLVGMVVRRHLLAHARRQPSRIVQRHSRSGRTARTECRKEAADHRPAVRRRRRFVGGVRSQDHRGGAPVLLRHGRLDRGVGSDSRPGTGPPVPVQRNPMRFRTGTTTRRTTPRPRASCANCSARTESSARSWDTAAATTSLRLQTVSRTHCRGWRAGWVRPGCPRRLFRGPNRGAGPGRSGRGRSPPPQPH